MKMIKNHKRVIVLAVLVLVAELVVFQCTDLGKGKFVFLGNNIDYSVSDIEDLGIVVGPDVYLIIIDEYPSTQTLDTYYNYDNSEFVNSLQTLGFYTPETSYTSYPETDMVLNCMLNMVSNPLNLEGVAGSSMPSSIYRDTLVNDVFQSYGYTTINLGSAWGGTIENPYADVSLVASRNPCNDWESVFPFQMESVKSIPDLEGSTFTFMHTIGAHRPWIFSADGTVREYIDCPEYMLDQVSYVSDCILDAMETILERSDSPPVILLMSDHGPFLPGFSTYSDLEITGRLNNFMAVYLPDGNYNEWPYGQINFFRYIFNTYLGTDYSYLPVEHYYVIDWESSPLVLEEVSEKLGIKY